MKQGLAIGLLLVLLVNSSMWLIGFPNASAQTYVSIYETKMFCPQCLKLGATSKVALGGIDGRSYKYLPKFESQFWDEHGDYHNHDMGCSYFSCSNGHMFRHYDSKCWCGWPYGIDIPDT